MQNQIPSTGLMIILSSPSGAGKTSLAKAIIAADPETRLSISVTTRPARPNEIDGKDYFFVTQRQYNELLQNTLLIEHAEVFGYNYGTPKKQTEEMLSNGLDVVYDIDWQGALQLIQTTKLRVVSIFILPPSLTILEQRLRSRASDSEETIKKRLDGAKLEISKCTHYDYVVINNDLSDTLKLIQSIITAERLKRTHLIGLNRFVEELHGSVKEVTEQDMQTMDNHIVIDVRELQEWQSGHIPGAIHIPLAQLLAENYDLDKSKLYIINCLHGIRSLTAAHFLKDHGFLQIAHLKGGLAMWQGKLSIK